MKEEQSKWPLEFKFSDLPTLNILNGNRFMISSSLGDITAPGHGVFRHDTRFLSYYETKINGQKLDKLTSKNTTNYASVLYLTNPILPSEYPAPSRRIRRKKKQATDDSNSIIDPRSIVVERKRFIENNVNEDITLTNVSGKDVSFKLTFALDADFQDLFTVKSDVYGRGFDRRSTTSSMRWNSRFDRAHNAFSFACTDPTTGFDAETIVWFSRKGRVVRPGGVGTKRRMKEGTHNTITFDLNLKPKESDKLTIVIVPMIGREEKSAFEKKNYEPEHFEQERDKLARAANTWRMNVPVLRTNFEYLQHAYDESMIDILSLKMNDPTRTHDWNLIAAGCPWYMTVFGRDSLITSYQSLIFGSELPKGSIEALSFYQSKVEDKRRDAEPGKIIHEMRYGDYALKTKLYPYYGTVDATPLFLILISEIYRWTLDSDFVERHTASIKDALSWIDTYGDSDHDGFVEYSKKSANGLDNQCWKDSWNSIQYSDGRIARGSIATCEVQGYVYDAKMRISELAKEVWKDNSLSKKLLDEANELKELFNEEYWIEGKGYYALALDGEKNQVDSMTSNNGQLFWSGIVADDKVNSVIENLFDDSLFSGYGIRTLSTQDRGFDPIGYHTGCVWPHDNSLVAKGLADYGKSKEAMQIVSAILDASSYFGYILPEAFAGFSRQETGFPVRYPNSCSPQGWASGATFLLLRTMLGIKPSRSQRTISIDPIFLKEISTYGRIRVSLENIVAFGKRFNLRISESGKPEVEDVSDEGLIRSAVEAGERKDATGIQLSENS